MKKKLSIAVLGSTGSIGQTTLKILSKYPNKFNVNLLSCNNNKKILSQIKKYSPKFVIINDKKLYNYIKKITFKKKIKIFNSLNEFKVHFQFKFDKVILGISSIHGIDYAFSFLNLSNEMLIANKETIVCGGKFFLNYAKKIGCLIKSIDSEHYCLSNILSSLNSKKIKRIYLTASGGPFLNKKISEIKYSNPKIALKHPVWKMGKKISIDSATMANKGLEIIEASILFNINPNIIKIKIHPESKVHCVVILKNNLVYFVSHNTSMSIPIENALFDNKLNNKEKNFFLSKKNFSFNFDETKLKKFKILFLAYKALNIGPRACIFYNVVNDYLVNLYLSKKIFFYEIHFKLNKLYINKNLLKYYKKKIKNLDDIYETISYAKEQAKYL